MMTTSRDIDDEGRDPHPDLVALIRYELSNADALMVGDHLATCAQCRDELAELVVGASVMGRAARTLASAPTRPTTSETLPPLSLPAGRRALRRERWLLAAAAVVVIGAIGALTVGLVRGTSEVPEAAPPDDGRSVILSAVEGDEPGSTPFADASGEVVLSTGEAATTLTFATDGLPETGTDEFYEAWLLDPDTEKMLPLGLVSRAGDTTFEVANSLLDQYAAFDLSLEADDGDPRHSATSVLRGTL